MALSNAERQQRWREKRNEQNPRVVQYRKPADRRTRPQQWADAISTLHRLLDDYQTWRDSLPQALEGTTTAERLDAMLELRDLVEQLETAEPPKGFGRD